MPWAKGQSGNPGGKAKGSRRAKLSEGFIKKLHQDWREHGIEAIQAVRESSPAEYLKLVASVLPKEGYVSGKIDHAHTHERLSETDALLASMFADGETAPLSEPSEARPLLPN